MAQCGCGRSWLSVNRNHSGVFVVVVEVDAKEEIFQMRLVTSVDQFGHHWTKTDKQKSLYFHIYFYIFFSQISELMPH